MSDERSRRGVPVRILLAAVLALGLLAGVPGALWLRGGAAVGEVTASTGAASCEGTEPTDVTVSEDEGFVQDGIPMVEGFRCVLTVGVTNGSSSEIDLGVLSVPVSGPGGGAGMRLTRIDGVGVAEGDAVDAEADLDRTVAAGAEDYLELEVRFRPSGCASPGGRLRLTPTLEVGHLLATRQLPIGDLPLFLGTRDTSCDT